MPTIPIIHFYILKLFNIQGHFYNSLYVKVSGSVQSVSSSRRYHINKPCHKLHHYIPACSTRKHTLIHTPAILSPAPEDIVQFKTITFCTIKPTNASYFIVNF